MMKQVFSGAVSNLYLATACVSASVSVSVTPIVTRAPPDGWLEIEIWTAEIQNESDSFNDRFNTECQENSSRLTLQW